MPGDHRGRMPDVCPADSHVRARHLAARTVRAHRRDPDTQVGGDIGGRPPFGGGIWLVRREVSGRRLAHAIKGTPRDGPRTERAREVAGGGTNSRQLLDSLCTGQTGGPRASRQSHARQVA
jgi:hypothetical protein